MSVVFTQDLRMIFKPSDDVKGKRDIVYIMSHPNPTSEHILSRGIFESELIGWACENYKNPEKIFVDIGAHMGTYSFNLAPHFKHTHAFEAQKKTYECLAGGIALNNLSDKVTSYHCALTSPEESGGSTTLRIVSEDGGGSSIKDLYSTSSPITTEETETECLDDFELEDIGLIKIDVEGAELDVIKGSVKTLKKSGYPPIIFEAWPDSWFASQKKELFDYITKTFGYKIQNIYSNNMFLATK